MHIAIGDGIRENYKISFITYCSLELSLITIAPDEVIRELGPIRKAMISYRRVRLDDCKDFGYEKERKDMQICLAALIFRMRKDTLESSNINQKLIEELLGL